MLARLHEQCGWISITSVHVPGWRAMVAEAGHRSGASAARPGVDSKARMERTAAATVTTRLAQAKAKPLKRTSRFIFPHRVERRDDLIVFFEPDAARHHQLDPLAERNGEEVRRIETPDVPIGKMDHRLVEVHDVIPRPVSRGPDGTLSRFRQCKVKPYDLRPLIGQERKVGKCPCGVGHFDPAAPHGPEGFDGTPL